MATAKKEGDEGKKKGKGKLLLIIGALVVLAAGGAGAFVMLKGGHPKSAEQAAAESAKAKPAVYLQLDPAFVVNFQDAVSYTHLTLPTKLL